MLLNGRGRAALVKESWRASLAARLSQGGLLRSIGILVGGTASAHAITAVAMPIVTRLYTPEDMNVLAVFAGLLAIFYVSVCLRFDIALPLPERDEEAANLLGLGAASAILLTSGLMLVVLLVPTGAYNAYGYGGFAPYAWLVPPATLVAGLYSLSQYWFVRRRAFGIIAQSRISQSAASAAAQLGLGVAGFGPVGLVLGHAVNSGAGAALLGARLFRRERAVLAAISLSGMRKAWRIHHRFPRYSALEALANVCGIHLPVVMIAGLAVGPEAGFLVLALYVMQAPMSLIGTAISQVYLSEAPAKHRAAELGSYTSEILAGLAKAGIGPLIFIGIISPFAFPWIFGPEWGRAGLLVAWMTPWFVLQFLTTPISMALHVTSGQRVALNLQLLGLIVRVGMVWAAGLWAVGWVSETFAVSGLIFYSIYLVAIVRRIGCGATALARIGRAALPPASGWAASGIVLAALINLLGSPTT
jgi:O-antigen/teichoic acid export membrane protein